MAIRRKDTGEKIDLSTQRTVTPVYAIEPWKPAAVKKPTERSVKPAITQDVSGEAWTRATPSQTTIPSRSATLKDVTLNAAKQGYYNALYGRESYSAMMGEENEKKKYEDILAGDEYQYEADSWWKKALSGAANLLGQQRAQIEDKRTLNAALAGAGTFAAGAALIGQAGPQVLVPEEVVTVPAAAVKGFLAGMETGSAAANFEIEAGLAYNEMLEQGISEDTAKMVALSVGGVNAALEFLQVDKLLKSFKILNRSGATKGVAQKIAQELMDRGIDVGKETLQEVAQEGVTIAGTQAASKYETGDWAYDAGEVAGRLGETAGSAALSFGTLNVPSAGLHIADIARSQRNGGATRQNVLTSEMDGQTSSTPEAVQTVDPLQRAAEQMAQEGRVSGKSADRILSDAAALDRLTQDAGLSLTDDMSMAQRRKAVQSAAERLARGQERGASVGGVTAAEDVDPLTRALAGGKRVDNTTLTEEQLEAWNSHEDVAMDAAGMVYQVDPAQHISQRTWEGVGSKAVNAFQFDHPELRYYYRQAAEDLIKDASLSLDFPSVRRTERTMQGKRRIMEIVESPALRSAMDMGLSRNNIIQAAEDLIADHGQENYAAAKRLEFILDDMLTRGYTTVEGNTVGPNELYIREKERIVGYVPEQREELPIRDMDIPTALPDRGRNTAELAYDLQQVRRAAAALGESGSRALTAAYDENTARYYSPEEVVDSFFHVYQDTMDGKALNEATAQKADALPSHLRFAAESAAQQDRVRAEQAKYFGEDAKLVRDANWKKAHLSTRTSRILDALGKALGIQIRFAETVAGGAANAQYKNGVITLALDARDPVMTSVVHEIVHRIREASPETYIEMAAFVRENMSEEGLEFNLSERSGLYRTDDLDTLTEETVADAFGRMVNIDALAERFAQEHRSAAQKLMDAVHDIINAVRRVLSRQNLQLTKEQREAFRDLEKRLGAMERVFSDALDAAAKLTKALEASAKQASALRNGVSGGNSVIGTEGGYAEVNGKFSLKGVLEDNGKLIAIHNLSEKKLLGDLKLGGLPMPSIAIVQAKAGHTKYGEISLVFAKETIDPQFMRRNKVYGGDAWTPTFPAVEYEVNDTKLDNIKKYVYSWAEREDIERIGHLGLDTSNLEDGLNRNDGDPVAIFRNNAGMKYVYLMATDSGFALPMKEESLGRNSGHDNAVILAVCDALGADMLQELREGGYQRYKTDEATVNRLLNIIDEAYTKIVGESVRGLFKDLSFSEYDRLISDAARYAHHGKGAIGQEVDISAAKKEIDKCVDQETYEGWVRNLFDGIIKKSGIRNEKDTFAPSGNRRSFDALHYEATLENIIKVMLKDTQKGGNAFLGGGEIWGVATKDYSSIDEIRSDAERLGNLPDEEYDAIRERYSQRLAAICDEIKDRNERNHFIAMDDAASAIVETLRTKKTRAAVDRELRTYRQLNIRDDTAQKVLDLVNDIKNMPTSYFEAKPQRAVGFDEVLAAIIPDDSGKELRKELDSAGIRTLEYKSGDDMDRLRAVNSVDGARFSIKMDSQGRTLTKQQQEYFRDTAAKDSRGRLIVMYHGTRKGGFTVFRDWSYLTANRKYAERYADRDTGETMYEVYANIKKPFDTRIEECRFIWQKGFYGKYSRTPLQDSGLPDWTDGYDLVDFLEENGYEYDAILLDEGADAVDGSAVERGISYVVRSSEQIKSVDNKNPTEDRDIRYSLKPVPPVKPTSKDWKPGATFDEVKAAYPSLFALDADEAETRNPTQITGTVKSYRKIYDVLKAEGFNGTILDASSGLGYGTRAGREEYGFEVDDIEPFPDAKYSPMFTDYSALDKTYDVIINNAVLNVMPQDLRDALVVKMGEMLKPGGRAFINVRGSDVKNASSKVAINDDLMEYFISNTGSYQKGFTQKELVAYLKDALGERFSVEPTKKFGGVSAVITRNRGNYSLKGSEATQDIAELLRENEYLRERLEHWKGQLKETTPATRTLRQDDIDKLARRLVREYGGTLKASSISEKLKSLGEFIIRGGDGKDELTWAGAHEKALDIARDLVENAVSVNDDMYQQYGDLRKYLRTTKLTISEADSRDIPDYAGFRKHNFGRINLSKGSTNVDQVYQELSTLWPEFFDEQQESNPADQLLHIADVLDGLQPIYENLYSYDMDAAEEYAAGDILDSLIGEDVRQAYTYADRQKKRAALKLEQAVKRAVARERGKRDEAVRRLKDHYAQKRKDQAERRADSAARTRLLHIVKRLKNKKLPAVNRALLDQYIGELDTVSRRMTGSTVNNLTDLKHWYETQKETDPDFLADPHIEKKIGRLEKVSIDTLTPDQVADLTEVLLYIENEIKTKRKLIDTQDRRDVYHMGEEIIRNIDNTKGSNSALDKFIVTETLSPLRQVRRMTGYVDSDPLYKLTKGLADGQRAMLDYQMKAERPFQKFASDKAFSKTFSGPTAKIIQISGQTKDGLQSVSISPAMRVSLYLHSLNDDNLRHIKEGGVTVPDEKLYREGKLTEAYARGATIKLTPSQVRTIVAGMTEKERAFARAAQKYFNETSRTAINETSEKLKGYPLAQEENYFPIDTDTSFTRSEFETLKHDGTIEGMGFLKERVQASNPILLRDVNAVLEQAIQVHGKYVGLAIPVRNFNKVWNVTTGSYREDGSRSNFEGSVQKAVKERWGETGYGYIEKLMTDLQGGSSQKNVWVRALNKIRSNYAGAVLTLNLSVAMKQAASYPTAAAVLGWRPLARAMADFGKLDLANIEKYTPLQWYRSKGFSTKELGDLKMVDRQLPAILNWVQGIDLLTTRKLWKASEYYVRQHNKDLTAGTNAYYKAVADIYDRVIEETQPNYTTMQRPQLLRSDDTLMGNLAMFKTQPFQNFNIVYDAAGNFAAKADRAKHGGEQEKAEARKAKSDLGRAVTSQLAQLAIFAGMTMAWAILRGRTDKYEDDEEDMTLSSILTAIGKDMAGGALSSVPFGSDAWELMSSKLFGDAYYGLDAVTVTAISDTIQSLGGLTEQVGRIAKNAASGTETDWNAERLKLDGILDDISKAAGVPYENVANLFKIIYRKTVVASLGKYQGEYAYLKLTTDPKKRPSDYYDLLYQAMQKNRTDYEAIYNDMVGNGIPEGKIRNAMETRMKRDQGVKSVEDLERRYLTPKQEKSYNSVRQSVAGTTIWSAASAEQREALESDLYDLTVGDSYGVWLQEKIDGGAAHGIDETDYLLYRLALSITDKPTESGKMGSYTNDEVEEAINMLTGLSDEARSYLWTAQGKSENSNPWG